MRTTRLNEIARGLLLAALWPASLAHADLIVANSRSVFTVEEQVIIDRNASLKELVDREPALVRRALDAIDQANAAWSSRDMKPPARRPEPVPDAAHNPDLDNLGRSSPEAAHDLFLLIKKASRSPKSD
jgi:hypothetical protein